MQGQANPNEFFAPTQRTLCRETGLDETEISRLLSSGKLKPCRERNGQKYYATADLSALKDEKRRRIVARASRLNPDERRKLISELAAESAYLHFRNETTRMDLQAAERRVEEAEFDSQIERLEASVDEISAKLTSRLGNLLQATPSGRLQLRAEKIDIAGSVIRGACVAMANVQAIGKFFTAPDGEKYPIFTDSKTLDTLLAASRDNIKVREDHSDEVGARAGFAGNFKRSGDCVVCDVTLFTSYAHRAVVLETAARTPQQIGLSIDFLPEFELIGGKAFMRVARLEAVDLVDSGAITHNGLL